MGKKSNPTMTIIEEIFEDDEGAAAEDSPVVVGQAVVGGVKIAAEEGARREIAAGDEAWHWKEIDLKPFITKRLPELFKKVSITKRDDCDIELFKAEHWGEAFATQRKGVGKLVCTFRIDVKWRGILKLNGAVVGRCQGTIRLPEVSAEKPPAEWELKAVCDGEDQSAMRMLNPCGSLEETPIRDLEPAELAIKKVMLEETPQRVLKLVTQLMREIVEKAKASRSLIPDEPEPEAAADEVSPVILAQVKAQMEQMRVDHLPAKLTEAIAAMHLNEQERFELTVHRITDVEVPQIADALKSNDTITLLDLSHNEIGDIGVQSLVTAMAMGAAKNLKELRITSNKGIGHMGRTMLTGLDAMRKNTKVLFDRDESK